MSLNFSNTHDLAQQSGVKMMVYGSSGSGKTRLIQTAPAPFIISAESGLLSLQDGPNIPVQIVNTVQDMEDIYQWLLNDPNSQQFQTICLDSFTELAEIVLADQKLKCKDTRRAYGETADILIQFIKNFRDLPNRNVYFSAKLDKWTDQLMNVTKYGASVPGNALKQGLDYYFDEVFCIGPVMFPDPNNPATMKEVTCLRTQLDVQYNAKDRSGRLDQFEIPDLNHIINKIKTPRG